MRILLAPVALAAAIALAPSAFAATAAKPMAAKPAATTSTMAAKPASAMAAAKPTAMAAMQTTTGSIKVYNTKAHTLKLDNGKLYHLPMDFKDPGLKVGDKVSVSWEMKKGKHAASDVTLVK